MYNTILIYNYTICNGMHIILCFVDTSHYPAARMRTAGLGSVRCLSVSGPKNIVMPTKRSIYGFIYVRTVIIGLKTYLLPLACISFVHASYFQQLDLFQNLTFFAPPTISIALVV